ncbi:hypothetical protein N9F50_00370 [Akkermansiaceae bacterium]|nr:hypothetical protein [Akkermansiaceae bacterium]
MGKGYDENQVRLQTLSSFGKDLARRAKSSCELSQESGVPLKIYEVPPVKGDPDFERCLFLSEKTIASLDKPKTLVPDEWRQLGELIWSELPLVQLMAVRILTYLADEKGANWCREIIDEAYLDEEIIAAAEAAPLK